MGKDKPLAGCVHRQWCFAINRPSRQALCYTDYCRLHDIFWHFRYLVTKGADLLLCFKAVWNSPDVPFLISVMIFSGMGDASVFCISSCCTKCYGLIQAFPLGRRRLPCTSCFTSALMACLSCSRACWASSSTTCQSLWLQCDFLWPIPLGWHGACSGTAAGEHFAGPTVPQWLCYPALQLEWTQSSSY